MPKYIKKINNVLVGGGGSGGGSFTPFTQTIVCDGIETSYIVTHNKNNLSPTGSVSVLNTVDNTYQPLDWTQGIKNNGVNTVLFNPMAYQGNIAGTTYKITIVA